jgi:hypothetical protein
VHEHVFPTIVTDDKTKTLLRVEEFDDALAFANDLGGHATTAAAATATETAAAATTAETAAATAAVAASAATVAEAASAATAKAAAVTEAAATAAVAATAATVSEAAATALIAECLAAAAAEEIVTFVAAAPAAVAFAPFIKTHVSSNFFFRPPISKPTRSGQGAIGSLARVSITHCSLPYRKNGGHSSY